MNILNKCLSYATTGEVIPDLAGFVFVCGNTFLLLEHLFTVCRWSLLWTDNDWKVESTSTSTVAILQFLFSFSYFLNARVFQKSRDTSFFLSLCCLCRLVCLGPGNNNQSRMLRKMLDGSIAFKDLLQVRKPSRERIYILYTSKYTLKLGRWGFVFDIFCRVFFFSYFFLTTKFIKTNLIFRKKEQKLWLLIFHVTFPVGMVQEMVTNIVTSVIQNCQVTSD